MKFDLVGRKPLLHRDREPGTILGEKRICCYRCGDEFPASKLTTVPPGAKPDRPRIYVCSDCS